MAKFHLPSFSLYLYIVLGATSSPLHCYNFIIFWKESFFAIAQAFHFSIHIVFPNADSWWPNNDSVSALHFQLATACESHLHHKAWFSRSMKTLLKTVAQKVRAKKDNFVKISWTTSLALARWDDKENKILALIPPEMQDTIQLLSPVDL